MLVRAPIELTCCERIPRVSVRKTLQDDEEFFMIRSRSVHLRLLHSQGKPRNPEFHLGDFAQPGLYTGLEHFSMEDEQKEGRVQTWAIQ